ncbi:transposase [Hamadaea sp. NPDC050747]|uniref:transposase n=1 Tax=Hamadaea sp. NPDC050747 TaxID=3155789 RepID=UPI0033DE8EBE
MSFYLVCGQAAAAPPTAVPEHLPTTRPRRYPSDTSDVEWQLIAAYLPAGGTGGHGGRPVTYPRRDIVDAIRYLDHNSCVWRALPVDFPPWPIVYHYFRTWTRDGTLTRLHDGCANKFASPKAATHNRRRRSWTPNRCVLPRPSPSPAAATTPARRSTAASVTSSWTPPDCC